MAASPRKRVKVVPRGVVEKVMKSNFHAEKRFLRPDSNDTLPGFTLDVRQKIKVSATVRQTMLRNNITY
jgi:hypothetical protein